MRGSALHRDTAQRKRPTRVISPASERQRVKVSGQVCVACGASPCDPMHVIPRSLGGCDRPECVVPACRDCHRAYDEGRLDALPCLQGRWHLELAHAVSHVGLLAALERITNTRWMPREQTA